MPYGDRTGPVGRGFGCGRGYGFRQPIISKEDEKQMLEDQLTILKQDIETVQKRIKELK